jgi:hypothetical protein
LQIQKSTVSLHTHLRNTTVFLALKWGISSVGSERLPYKQDVGGSNPSFPTQKASQKCEAFFYSDRPDSKSRECQRFESVIPHSESFTGLASPFFGECEAFLFLEKFPYSQFYQL